jgi:NADH:ubiquinone oxidoreductase subunit C
MTGFEALPEAAAEVFGEDATATRAYDLLTVDVPAGSWIAALTTARDELGCTFFDWLSAVDEPGEGFRVCAHVVALGPGPGPGSVRRLLVRTTVPYENAALPTATGVYAGAGWHERETHEMFGVDFPGHPGLAKLLLPDEFEGYPLRKDFVLAARVAKAWPGAKEPGESHDGGPKRRQMLPPGVPDPNEWGPLKGQVPPPPARTPRAGAAGGAAAGRAAAAGDRPPRRMRSAAGGSASQSGAEAAGAAEQTGTSGGPEAPAVPPRKRTADAPWEQPREPEPKAAPEPKAEPEPKAAPEPKAEPEPDAGPKTEPEPESGAEPGGDEPSAPDDNDRDEPPAGGAT